MWKKPFIHAVVYFNHTPTYSSINLNPNNFSFYLMILRSCFKLPINFNQSKQHLSGIPLDRGCCAVWEAAASKVTIDPLLAADRWKISFITFTSKCNADYAILINRLEFGTGMKVTALNWFSWCNTLSVTTGNATSLTCGTQRGFTDYMIPFAFHFNDPVK